MKILVACEESQAVTIEMRRLGHEAYSCDIEPCSGGHPEWHLQVDALELLKMKWDMILAFPPCTHLAVSGARYFEQKRKDGRQQAAIDFFMQFAKVKLDIKSNGHGDIGVFNASHDKSLSLGFSGEYPCLFINASAVLWKESSGNVVAYLNVINGKSVSWTYSNELGKYVLTGT